MVYGTINHILLLDDESMPNEYICKSNLLILSILYVIYLVFLLYSDIKNSLPCNLSSHVNSYFCLIKMNTMNILPRMLAQSVCYGIHMAEAI